jgi:hypothetical protein
MDVGKDVRRHKAKPLAEIANKGFIEGWLLDNQQAFIETMETIKEGAPVQWAKLYADLYKMGITKETNLNISIINRQQDRENLQALVRTRLPAPAVEAVEYTPFEEMKSAEDILLGNNAEIKLERRKTTEED